MTSAPLDTIKEIFNAARDLEPAARNAYLEEICGNDFQLREDVDALLTAHPQSDDFIAEPLSQLAAEFFIGAEAHSNVGRMIGNYQLIEHIGSGGMGAVYLARRADKQFEMQVAIKLIKRGMDTDAVLERFRHERQILASLDHPNIARLLDGGTTKDGLPYFVMEYIEGQPIDEYADKHQLSVTERLKIFRQVCGAVSFAHQHLVIHRDLKPSNILVTANGVPKLLDFGIAKIIQSDDGADTLATTMGMRLMTPEYASPEQVQGAQATTLSDVYSLGAVLYKSLCGRPPYRIKSRSPQDFARAIDTAELEKPSTAVAKPDGNPRSQAPNPKLLRGDLDNIVLMAMRKETERRYRSVEQFSEDIRRHLVGLPVIARPDTLSYRAAKFVQRNKVIVVAAALLLLILVGGVVATTWQAHRAKLQEQKARTEEQRARAEQAIAERRFNDLRKLAHSVLFDYHDAIKDLPGSTPVRARLVHDAREYLDRLAAEAQGDVSLQRELAAAYERVGDVQGGAMFANLGDTKGAIESYRRSLRLREALMASSPHDIEMRRDVALSYRKLASLVWETGDLADALDNNRKALALFQSLTGEAAANLDLRFELQKTYDYNGMILEMQGDLAGALRNHRKALEILESSPAADRKIEKMRRYLSVVYEHIGWISLRMVDLDHALDYNRKALEVRTELVAEFPLNADYHRLLGVIHYNTGETLSKMGRDREALESYHKYLAQVEQLSAADPHNEQYRDDRAYALIAIGEELAKLGEFPKAFASYRKAIALRAEDVKADPLNLSKRASLIEVKAKMAKTLAKTRERDAALAMCAETLSLLDNTFVEPSNAEFRSNFATVYADLGEAYAIIAADAGRPASERSDQRQATRDMYQRSLEILQDMQTRGILSSDDAHRLELVSREVSKLNSHDLADKNGK
jgi:non-specific serine/threonine protein kinase/serine/threonine-protein kinase